MGEQLLVARLAVGLVVAQYVPLTDKTRRAAATTERAATPVLLQRLSEVGREEHLS